MYPDREESWEYIPKTLIFAKDDNHATQIVEAAKKVFAEKFPNGNLPSDYVQKITYSAGDSNALIRDLRTEKSFRIAVTVTLVATGTDVKPLEVVLFMNDVKSDVLYTQIKGRGCRVLHEDKLKEITPNANTKEWAASSLRDGFSNRYALDTEYMKILNLNSPDYTILNWIAVLVEHRLFTIKTPVARRAKRYLIDNFGVNVNAYDLITGYRADDSYFDYAESFLNNAISVELLANAMRLGKLGEQIVLKSQFAFSRIQFEGFEVAEKEEFYVLRKSRDDEANRLYLEMLEEETDGLYIQDIIRGGITNDDPRIPRNLSK